MEKRKNKETTQCGFLIDNYLPNPAAAFFSIFRMGS
jgi:hypothetical protein